MSSKINRNSRTFFYKFRSSVLWKLREFRLMEVSLETLVWMMWIKELFRMQYSWRSAKWPVWLLHEHYIRWTFIFKLWDFTDDLYNPTYIQFVNKKGIVDGIFPMPTITNVVWIIQSGLSRVRQSVFIFLTIVKGGYITFGNSIQTSF